MDADADLKAQQKMSFLVSPHIESFNFFLGEGIQRAVENIDPIEIETEDNRRFTSMFPVASTRGEKTI
jgi:DNA-directed RNA polymerase beta subunit